MPRNISFSDAFAKLRKATTRFVMSVCRFFRPSVRMEQLISHLTDFYANWYLSIFRKFVEKIQFELKYDKITGTFHEDLCAFTIIPRWILLRTRNVSDKHRRENQTHIVCSKTFSCKSWRLWDNVGKKWCSRTVRRW